MKNRCLLMLVMPMCMMLSACKQDTASTPSSAAASTSGAKSAPVTKALAIAAPFHLTQVNHDRIRFDPKKNQRVRIGYSIDDAAEVALHIYDGRNQLIYRSDVQAVTAGDHAHTWDGNDSAGNPVPPEAYHYVLVATNQKGSVTHDLTDITGNEALVVANPVWDAKAGLLRYRLDKAARVNIRLGLADGPFLRTVVDWVPREAGDQTQAWDGWDASKVLNVSAHPLLSPSVRAYTLPDNTVFVGADVDAIEFVSSASLGVRAQQLKTDKKRMYFHADQPLETRGDIPLALTIMGNGERDSDGRWVVSGQVPIRLDVPPELRARVLQRRFEPAFFTDGIFAFETEMGALPITWQWDSTVVNPGEHYITTNIRGYEGNYGTATLKVWVKPNAAPSAVSPAQESTP
jgi:FlgD Ig-like domain